MTLYPIISLVVQKNTFYSACCFIHIETMLAFRWQQWSTIKYKQMKPGNETVFWFQRNFFIRKQRCTNWKIFILIEIIGIHRARHVKFLFMSWRKSSHISNVSLISCFVVTRGNCCGLSGTWNLWAHLGDSEKLNKHACGRTRSQLKKR